MFHARDERKPVWKKTFNSNQAITEFYLVIFDFISEWKKESPKIKQAIAKKLNKIDYQRKYIIIILLRRRITYGPINVITLDRIAYLILNVYMAKNFSSIIRRNQQKKSCDRCINESQDDRSLWVISQKSKDI